MRILTVFLGLLLAASGASAQVAVELLLDEPEFLRDESLIVKVRVTNRSGRPLQLGQSNDWLSFTIQASDGAAVLRLSDPPVAGLFTIESGQAATKSVDLMPCFDFPDTGRYTISALVRIPQWAGEIASPGRTFHLIKGSRLWEEEFGLPGREGPPEARKYSLVRANGVKQQRLYVRITDPDERRVFKVAPVGQMVSFGRPEALVDGTSLLHILFQNGPRSFLYGAFDPDGTWKARLTFDYGSTRPTLRVSQQGQVHVAGGLRRVTPSDILPKSATAEPKPSAAPAPAPPPSATPPPPAAPATPAKPAPTRLKDDSPAKP